MQTMILQPQDIYAGNLILVNRDHPYREGCCEKRLVPASGMCNRVLLESGTASMLGDLMDRLDCRDQITAVSGFRSQYEQDSIYQSCLEDKGEAFTKSYVALPNHSEHQSGMAVDLGLMQPEIDELTPYFPDEGVCRDFRAAMTAYGFIERYPKGKEHITHIAHEPWHFRYVGIPHAALMVQKGLCLEEYILHLRQYHTAPLRFREGGHAYEITFLPVEDGPVAVPMPQSPFQVSGNNVDGFILTVWA